MSSPNGLVCFTNCFLPQEDGSLVAKDLWIDERRGVIVDAQVGLSPSSSERLSLIRLQRTFFLRKERPARTVDLKGNVLRHLFCLLK